MQSKLWSLRRKNPSLCVSATVQFMGFDSLGFETSPPPKSVIPSAIVENEAGLARCFWIKFRRESVFALFHPFSLCYVTATVPISLLLVALEYITLGSGAWNGV